LRAIRTFVTGESVRVTVPDASALPAPVCSAVVQAGRQELELNASRRAGRDFFLRATGSPLTGSMTLRSGLLLRHGPLGGRARSGRVFTLDVGRHDVYGSCGAQVSLTELASIVQRISLRDSASGAAATLRTGVSWARRRPASIAQMVELGDGQGFLLDIRQARSGSARTQGLEVDGGLLSRSGDGERVSYLVLDTERAVSYGIPRPGTALDVVAEAMRRVRVEAV